MEEETKCYCGHTTYCDCGPEEPKQETLEEGFKRIYESMDFTEFCFPSFKLGTEWKQEQDKNKYGEEELKKLMFDFYYDMSHKMNVPENLISENMINVDVWLENFKNKK